MKVLFNDKFIERDNPKVDIEDRSYQFGDGIYEVVGVYSGKLFKMKEHLKRLERSANELNISLPYSLEIIERKIEELRSLNNLENGIIYFQISRGTAQRNHNFPSVETKPVFVAYTKEMDQPVEQQNEGVSCILTEDIRWLRCDIKTLNLLGSVLAKQKAIESNCYEAILVRGKTVTEGSSANLFIVRDNRLYTHPANNYILSGISRGVVLDICQHLDIEVAEETYNVDKLLKADEVFLTGTFIDVVPVTRIDQTNINSGNPGPITKQIQQEFAALVG